MRVKILLPALFLLFSAASSFSLPQTKAARRTLDIYFIDVEGGAATLIVTPAGESALIDAGWDGFDGRDAKRIQQAMRQAGITAIDHLVTTHYHRDHYGGVPELAKLVPIRRFYDHGKMTSLADDPQFAERYGAYQAAAKGQTTTLKPGDTIPLKTANGAPPIKLLCVASHAAVIGGENASANPTCTSAEPNEDTSDNARSVALLLKFGDFEFINLADLSWNVSKRLVCPANQIGEVDLYQVTHHGGNVSNDPALLRSLRPTVAVMINGPRKGGHPDTIKWLRETPSFKALYQLHRNVQTSAEQNAPAEFIANLDEQPDAANMITVSVDATKRAFTVTNGRTKESRSYQFKPASRPGNTAFAPQVETQQAAANTSPLLFEFDRLIYDEQQRWLVIVNGYRAPNKPELAELWGWDGKDWKLIPGSGPSMRTNSAAVYDSRRKRIVLYGGVGNKASREYDDRRGDTWEWDGKRWFQDEIAPRFQTDGRQ